MQKLSRLLLPGCFLTTLLLCAKPAAEPALWYQWQSLQTGIYICKQTDPGPGWRRHSGPYLDGGCRQLKQPPALRPVTAEAPETL